MVRSMREVSWTGPGLGKGGKHRARVQTLPRGPTTPPERERHLNCCSVGSTPAGLNS
jgi:hypothetical protein